MEQPNLTDKISKHFTWKEAIYLPQWGRAATEDDGLSDTILENLKRLFAQMDIVRDYFGAPINVHVAIRPLKYNHELYERMNKDREAKGLAPLTETTNSPHIWGLAVDFDVVGLTCDEAVKKILDDKKLDEWKMRMEHNPPGSGWVHLDIRDLIPGHNRYFLP